MNTNFEKVSSREFSVSFEYNAPMADFANQYRNCQTDYVAECIFPSIRVPACDFKWVNWDRVHNYQLVNDFAGDCSQIHEISFQPHDLLPGTTELHALEYKWGHCQNQALALGSCSDVPNGWLNSQVQSIVDKIMLNKEKDVADIINNVGTYDAANVISLAGAEINLPTPGPLLAPIMDIQYSGQHGGYNSMLVTRRVLGAMLRHPDVIANGALNVVSNIDALAALFGVSRICVANSFADQGAGVATLFNDAILLFNSPAQTNSVVCDRPSFGFNAESSPFEVRTRLDMDHGIYGAERLAVGQYRKLVVADNTMAHYFTNVLV